MTSFIKKITIALVVTALSASHAFAFSDIKRSPFETAILDLKKQKIVKGDLGKNTFRPRETINRAEITKIVALHAVSKDPEVKYPETEIEKYRGDCFPDVSSRQWYSPYVCYAKNKGWVKGFGDGEFKPGQKVTNFEALKIAAVGQNIQFEEVPGQPWYTNLVGVLSESNLIPFNVYGANSEFTREQMADLIVRIQKDQNGELASYLEENAYRQATLETIEKNIDLTNYQTTSYSVN
jgi:hypothetical protein